MPVAARLVTLMSRAETWVMFNPGIGRSSSAKFCDVACWIALAVITDIVAGRVGDLLLGSRGTDDNRLFVLLLLIRRGRRLLASWQVGRRRGFLSRGLRVPALCGACPAATGRAAAR